MSSEPKSPPPPRKPLPSAEEIQAYVELSAARTKKRLTLASGNANVCCPNITIKVGMIASVSGTLITSRVPSPTFEMI